MTTQSTNNNINSIKVKLKLGLLNVENLFLLFDQEIPLHYQKINESQWQKLSSSVYETKPMNKCQQIAKVITENAPDIMMLCEVGGAESLNNFNKLFLQSQYHTALIEGNSDRNIDVGFLYPHETTSKKTSYPIKGQSQFFSRDCAELRLFTKTKEDPFLIILLTHLKSRLDPERIDPGGVERRSAEFRTCLEIYRELKIQFKNIPIVFSGDMNGFAGKPNTDTEFLPLYSETDLEDVLEIANVSVD